VSVAAPKHLSGVSEPSALSRRGRRAALLVFALAILASPATGSNAAGAEVLLGTQTIGGEHDGNAPGSAEAFSATATTTGTVGSLTVYVSSSSKAATIVVGLYAESGVGPGALLTQGSTISPQAGAWNQIAVPSVKVNAGTSYWIAVLGPTGTGEINFRDTSGGSLSVQSSQTSLTSLPSTWSAGPTWSSSPVSAYASGAVPTSPVLSVAPTSLSMEASAGGPDPPAASLSLENAGAGTLSFTASSDSSWLSVAPASGSAPQKLSVSASDAGLKAGTYTGHLTITASGAQGSPAVVPVTLTLTPPSPPAAGEWPTGDQSPERSSFAAGEEAINSSNVAGLTRLWSAPLDGKITAQPLYVGNVKVAGATRNVIVAATDADSLYALDAETGAVLWHVNFGPDTLTAGSIWAIPGGLGIIASPVIDRQDGRIYTVSDDGKLRVISLEDGAEALPATQVVVEPATNRVWGALQLFNGYIYVATGSDGGDTSPWRGGIYQVDVTGSVPAVVKHWVATPNIPEPGGGAGIWGYGGVSIDTANGHVYAATGDNEKGEYSEYADSIVALGSNLEVLGSYHPSNPTKFTCGAAPCDLDMASTPLVFKPSGCPAMVAAGSKNGDLYVMRESELEAGEEPLQTLTLNVPSDEPGKGGVVGVPAYWPAGGMLFITDSGAGTGGVAAGVVGLSVQSNCTLKVAWSHQLSETGSPNSTPTIADGNVYVGLGTGSVEAFDATTGTQLWSSGGIGGAVYGAPILAGGHLYAGAWNGFGESEKGTLFAFAPSAPPPPGGPSFVQQTAAEKHAVASLTLTPASNLTAGDRLIVEVGAWSYQNAGAATVTDSAGDQFTELAHFRGPDETEMSVWSAPVSAGAGTRPTITVKPSSTADVGAAVSEYAGLSSAAGTGVLDQIAHSSGRTGSSGATVSSGATPATTAGGELAVGFYADSGFGDSLGADPSFNLRTDLSPTEHMELLSEDQTVQAGATPDATVSTGAGTDWLMATLVFKAASEP
jgi:outer membrane protein assembly factor BamB